MIVLNLFVFIIIENFDNLSEFSNGFNTPTFRSKRSKISVIFGAQEKQSFS